MRRAALAALLACAACAGPRTLWTGTTPDRRHRIDIVQEGDLQWVLRDGQRRAGHRAIAAWTLAMSPDGAHLAYAARVAGAWSVVHDGRPHGRWDGVGDIVLAPRGARLAYAAERGGRWHVVVDGAAGPAWDSIFAGTLRFSPDGARVAYVARSGGGARVVVDGIAGPRWSGAGQLAFSADGAHVAYAARDGRAAHAVIDGRVGPRHRAVAQLVLAPRGGRAAYAALDATGWRVVDGRAAGPPFGAIRALGFSPDGAHLAWIARTGAEDLVVCDGAAVGGATSVRPELSFTAATDGAPHPVAYIARGPDGERAVTAAGAGPTFDEVGPLAVSRDGRRLGYAARRGAAWSIVIDGAELPAGDWASTPVFSPTGDRVAFLARRAGAGGVAVVVDGRAHRFDLAMDGTLVFSRDGRRWAVLAGDLARERLFIAVDGARRVPIAAREVYAAAVRMVSRAGSDAGVDPLRDWAQAEADRPVSP